MHNDYIEQRNNGYYLAGTRISLDSVVYCFNQGQSPEAIQEDFPLLKLSQIYGAIAFYLDHRAQIDSYLADTKWAFDDAGTPLAVENPALWERLQRAKAHPGEPRS
jgi:uncharacterized protein (DUF433 family)